MIVGSWALRRSIVAVGVILAGCGSDASPDPAAPPSPGEVRSAAIPAMTLPTTPQTPLFAALEAHVRERVLPAVAQVPDERRAQLARLAAFVAERRQQGQSAALTFICTHNSRRSQMGQVWAATAAAWLGVEGVRTFSGGTETTAFNPRAVAALQRAGFEIDDPGGDNPHRRVRMGAQAPELSCFSKRFGDDANPHEDFAAVMTCAAADASCPTVPGAALRLGLPYDDPKVADDTAQETARYDERSQQIAAEMFYAMSLVQATSGR